MILNTHTLIACRDYPHPRHLCAKFPFASTSHEKHCDLCHCYVCDAHAPCVHWGTGTSSMDHCHATDKEELWKLKRRSLKNGDRSPLPVSKLHNTCQSVGLPQMNHFSPPQTNHVSPLPLPLLAQNQVSTSTTTRSCSRSTNFSIPSIINQGRSQQSRYVLPRGKFQPHLVSQQLHSTSNNVFRKDRSQSVGNLAHKLFSTNSMPKRMGPVRVPLTTNNSGYGSSNSNYGSQYSGNPSPVATSNDKDPTRWQDFYSEMTSGSNTYWSSSQHNTSSILANPVPSRPPVSSQPNMSSIFVNSVLPQPPVSSQPNMDNIFVNPLPRQPDISSQPCMGNIFADSVPPQPQVSSQPSMDNNIFADSVPPQPQVPSQPRMDDIFADTVPLQPQVSSEPSMDNIFADSLPSQPQVSSQPTMKTIFANSAQVSQPQVYSQPIPDSNGNLDGCQQGNQTQSDLDSSFYSSWVTPTSHSNQQPPVENSQLPSSEAMYNLSLAPEFVPSFTVSPIADPLDFQLDSWLLENQSVSGVPEVSTLPGLNMLSSGPAHAIDTGNLFDF
ncbi:leucine-rich repeat extensin-like protein 5 isoform X2 [Cornus florida]|uniref:leucine-rich repeat extensin-like protein 5 isoform X2 n=1 Tax=Cornus florida TaxID=4283 RepID=UPI002896E6B8|nr:leucine-rich repeat extensin-like protein 5 isoform X2 [Cornus florida]